MKKIFLSLSLLICILTACKKIAVEPAVTKIEEEYPFQALLEKTKYNEFKADALKSEFSFKNHEIGFRFSPIVNGDITAIQVDLPKLQNNVRVVIWDNTTRKPIFSKSINYNLTNEILTLPIEPFSLVKDGQYTISFVAEGSVYFNSTKKAEDADIIKYPLVIGNIKILGQVVAKMSDPNVRVFPNEVYSNIAPFIFGNVGFAFKKSA